MEAGKPAHMDQSSRIQRIIFDALDAVRDILPPGVSLPSSPSAPLLEADGGALDSLGVVNLIVEVESRVEAEFSRSISLVSALAEMPETSPLRTVATLAAYVAAQLAS